VRTAEGWENENENEKEKEKRKRKRKRKRTKTTEEEERGKRKEDNIHQVQYLGLSKHIAKKKKTEQDAFFFRFRVR
jgi:hypothetical protein